MSYVDVAVIPIPEDKVEAYKKMAKTAAKYWIKHGALQYFECMGTIRRRARSRTSTAR